MRVNRWLALFELLVVIMALLVDASGLINRGVSALQHKQAHWPVVVSVGGTDFPLYLRRGLDLQGGTHIELEAEVRKGQDTHKAVQGVIDILTRRVNAIGVTEPIIQPEGVFGQTTNRISIDLPGVNEVRARQLIGQTAQLVFATVTTDPKTGQLKFVPTQLTGKDLVSATPGTDQLGAPDINLQFNDAGAALFDTLTKKAFAFPQGSPQNRIAILIDGKPVTVPNVRQEITGGQAQITGNFTIQQAQDLSIALSSGALPTPVKVLDSYSVGASLGTDSVRKTIIAGIVGLLIVALFMMLYYRLPGILAVVALGCYGAIVVALFKIIGVTLTLAGLAGFVLSVGMAVDANVLIFERLKEELRHGRTPAAAMEIGFRRAFPAIRDSNASTMITCAILFLFGSGLVKGFALTLGLGVAVSFFSAVFFTNLLLSFALHTMHARRRWLYGVEAAA